MSARSRQRPARRLRAVVLLTLALGLVAQSLVAVVGEFHELAEPAAIGHGHAAHHVAHDQEASDLAGTHTEAEGALHGLLHHTHSCSHCAWMTAGHPPPAMAFLSATRLPPEASGPAASTRITTPFRPPIRA